MPTPTGPNTGHGHVWARPDGHKARCGGPALCPECARDQTQLRAELQEPPEAPTASNPLTEAIRVLRLAEKAAGTDVSNQLVAIADRWLTIAGLHRD